MALELNAHRLNEAKPQPRKSVAQQLHDLIRENGHLRQEIQFYLTCTDEAHAMRVGADEVAQKMMLEFLLEGDCLGEPNAIGHRLAQELQHHLDRYSAAVYEAEW